MKRVDPSKPPVLSVCIIARNCADTVETTLKSVRERAPNAEVVIVDTMSSDGKTQEICQRYADKWIEWSGPNGKWNRDMLWFDDAAAARNKSFELATGKWRMWIDTDDELVGPDEATRLLKLNNRYRPGGNVKPKDAALSKNGEPVSLEDLLEWTEKTFPDLDAFKAPYLYEAREDGTAATWQVRERIVRADRDWAWRRKAHEILVPKDPARLGRVADLSHLLFVHRKKFTPEDRLYSLNRHWDVLIKMYEEGSETTVQDLLYLENYSIWKAPNRREEFINAAHARAHTPFDRMRVLVRAGNFAAERGFFLDAIEHFHAATGQFSSIPDAWIAGAIVFERVEDWDRAALWFDTATRTAVAHDMSEVAPRDQELEYRLRGALAYANAAKRDTANSNHEEAMRKHNRGVELIEAAYASASCTEEDRLALANHLALARNERDGERLTESLLAVWNYLVRNDETVKARRVLEVIPHNLADHPTVMSMERWARKLDKHLADPKAYQAFYSDESETGACPTEDRMLVPSTHLGRVKFLIDYLTKHKPDADVLEVGPFDGPVALPVLQALPKVRYFAVEASKASADRLRANAERFGVSHRLHIAIATDPGAAMKEMEREFGKTKFDAVVAFEIIEHVPDPYAFLVGLKWHVGDGGRLFVSTPWGAFDRGFPENMATRDPRGHVRAMMPRELVDVAAKSGLSVCELGGHHGHGNVGDTLHACFEVDSNAKGRNEWKNGVSFVVAGALWDWNGSHVRRTGIGASEETIVYLAEALAAKRRHWKNEIGAGTLRDWYPSIYGPIPSQFALKQEEVVQGVAYWPREKVRHINKHGTVVISRAPSFGKVVQDRVGHPLRKVLWLQDAYYPDLSPETAADYEWIVVLTEWHREVMHRNHGVPLEKMKIIPNFIVPTHFEQKVEREPHRFIYASSPDRGLTTLLKIWPRILQQLPDAKLSIFYGWDGCVKLGSVDPSWVQRYRAIREDYERLRGLPGIEDRGRINHTDLAREFLRSSAWLYPTAFDETGCLTAAKARAAGCIPVCTPRAALNETARCEQTNFVDMPMSLALNHNGSGIENDPLWSAYADRFTQAAVDATKVGEDVRAKMAIKARVEFSIANIMPLWEEIL